MEGRYFDLDVRSDGIVWIRRTSVPYAELGDIARAYRQLISAVHAQDTTLQLQRVARGDKGPYPFAWLYDLRDGPSARNDVAFEHAQEAATPLLFEHSALLCTLCATESGRLQISRMSQNKPNWFASCDETQAINELRRRLRTERKR